MRGRLLAALPVLVATALHAYVTHGVLVLALVVVMLVVAIPLSPYVDAAPFVQRATLLVVALLGALGGASALTSQEPLLSTRPSALLEGVLVTALMLATARRFFREAEGGVRLDFAIATIAVVACGERHIGPPYVAAAVLFVVAVVVMIRGRDTDAGWSVVEANAPLATGAMLLIVGSLSTLGMIVLPRLARITQRQFERYVLPASPSDVGFTDRLRTGSPDALVPSDQLVLRIYGPHVDYLRGRVYDTFDRGSWENTRTPPPAPIETLAGAPHDPTVTEIRGVGAFQRASTHARFFVPAGARGMGTTRGAALVDSMGTFRPVPDEPPTPIWFESGAPDFPAVPPTDVDLRVPEALRPTLAALAVEWTRDATTPRAKLAALEQHLARDFSYTLDGVAPSREPPLVTFLVHTRRGRCETFATALALLGRTLGVPTRVVGGFRVGEHNAIGGYDVVREKNAHAWVEGWVSGGWQTFDGTPATEANLRRDRRSIAAAGDALLAAWDRAMDLLGRASLWQFGVVLAGAVTLLTTVRVLRLRRERRGADTSAGAQDGPLPCFRSLERALAVAGYPRPPSEPLERYAARLRGGSLDRAADIVLEYGALRYGGIGEPDSLSARAEACAADVARAHRARGGSA